MTLIKQGKRVIVDVATLPATGESKYIYHNTTDGYNYYWNEVTGKFVKIEPLDVITTVQPTPTATGNTTNLNSTFKDANGDTWIVDSNGDAIKAGSSAITGDIYKTTSTTCNDIVSTGNLTFTVATGLAYTPLQDIILTAGGTGANHMHGEVVSYNSATGELVVNIHQKEGSGNFCDWTINLDAIKLAELSVYFGTTDPTTAGQVGIEGDFWYKTTNGTSTGSVLETYVYDGSAWVLVTRNEYTKITSIRPKVYTGSGYVDARANVIANVADALLLSDGTYLNSGRIVVTGHGYTVGNWYYLSQTTAGAVTDTYPLSGIVQQLFFVEDANTLLVNIEQAIDPNTPTYANLVYVNNTNVNSGTIFDLNNPPTTNNNALKNDVGNLYIGTDGSTWIWNGTAYVTKTFASTTEWLIAGTTVDAQGDKTNKIARTGWVTIGKNLVASSPLDVYNVGTNVYSVLGRFLNPDNKIAGNNTQLIFGAAQESGNAADWRFYYAGNNSASNRIDFGFSGYAAPMITYTVGYRVGIRQAGPNSTLHINGSFAAPIALSPGAVTLTENNFTYIFSSPGIAITLPSATGIDGRIYVIKNSSGGNLTMTGFIESGTSNTRTIPSQGSRIIQAFGGQWWIIGGIL